MTTGGRAARMLVIALAALLPFLHTLRYGFVYDDVPIIAERAELHGSSGIARAVTLPYWPESAQEGAGLYRPVAQLAYALLWAAGGGSPVLFHLYGLALHIAAALLVLLLLERAVDPLAALAGALVFAVHPVHVEAVANIVGSAEVVVGIAAVAYALAGWDPALGTRHPAGRWRAALGLAGLYAVGLGAKESGVTIPAAALVAWWGWRAPHESRERLTSLLMRGRLVWGLSGLVLMGLTAARWGVLGTLALDPDAVAIGIKDATAWARVWTMLAAMPLVGTLLLWPASLSMHYGPGTIPPHSGPTTVAIVSLLAIALVVALALVRARTGDRRPLAALAWIGITYLPASNLLVPTGQLLAERTLYLPSVGVAMLAAWGVAMARDAIAVRRLTIRPMVAALPLVAIVVAGALRSATAASRWSDNYTLFASGITGRPGEYRPYLSLASWQLRQGHRADALALFDRAWSLYPRDPKLSLNYGRELLAAGDAERALAVLRTGTGVAPRSPLLRVQYLSALLAARGPDSLLADVRAHPAPDPAGASRTLFLARAFEAKREPDSVVAVLGAAAAESPRDGSLAYLLAVALHRASRDAEAARQLDTADRLADAPVVARAYLRAQVALALGDSAAAKAAASAARAAAPGDTAVERLYSELHSR